MFQARLAIDKNLREIPDPWLRRREENILQVQRDYGYNRTDAEKFYEM